MHLKLTDKLDKIHFDADQCILSTLTSHSPVVTLPKCVYVEYHLRKVY